MDINRRMPLSANAKLELEWWVSNVMTAKNVMSRGQPSCELKTDASNEGWRPVFGTQEKCHHINYPELLAVFLGLEAFFDSHRNSHIR